MRSIPESSRRFWPRRSRAKSRTSSRKRASGIRASTRPSLRALRPATVLPVRIRSRASAMPMRRGRRVEPPQAGRMPSCTSGRPIRVSGRSLATRQVEAREISRPPPRQTPRMAATVGKGRASQAANRRWPTREPASASTGSVTRAISSTSAPAMKLPGLPERRIRQPTSCRPLSSSRTLSSSCRAVRVKTLTFLSVVSNVSVASRSAPISRWNLAAKVNLLESPRHPALFSCRTFPRPEALTPGPFPAPSHPPHRERGNPARAFLLFSLFSR